MAELKLDRQVVDVVNILIFRVYTEILARLLVRPADEGIMLFRVGYLTSLK